MKATGRLAIECIASPTCENAKCLARAMLNMGQSATVNVRLKQFNNRVVVPPKQNNRRPRSTPWETCLKNFMKTQRPCHACLPLADFNL